MLHFFRSTTNELSSSQTYATALMTSSSMIIQNVNALDTSLDCIVFNAECAAQSTRRYQRIGYLVERCAKLSQEITFLNNVIYVLHIVPKQRGNILSKMHSTRAICMLSYEDTREQRLVMRRQKLRQRDRETRCAE